MAELVLSVLLAAVVLYVVFGGADFGVGMVEFWLPEHRQKQLEQALLPVWEANHVWLVIAAVISFVAFPPLFTLISTYLHIPIVLALLGIVARGSAFTFRHYDPAVARDPSLHGWYTWIFRLSSLLTPLFLGVIVAALVQGKLPARLDPTPAAGAEAASFYALFVAPWNTLFCWATGVFTCTLFAFEGTALLAAEYPRATGPLPLLRLTRSLHGLCIAAGFVVLVIAYFSGVTWLTELFMQPRGLFALLAASALTPVIAYAFHQGRPWLLRLAMASQALCVLSGCFGAQYPFLIRLEQGAGLRIEDAAAPPATLRTLLWALGIGLALIAPALGYLLRVYKRVPGELDSPRH